MFLKFNKVDDKLIVTLVGELDHHSAEEVRVKIDDRIERDNIKKVIMDFKEVTFMDSSGIGVVIGRLKKVKNRDGRDYVIRAPYKMLKFRPDFARKDNRRRLSEMNVGSKNGGAGNEWKINK